MCHDDSIDDGMWMLIEEFISGELTRETCEFVTGLRNTLDIKRERMLNHVYNLDIKGQFVLTRRDNDIGFDDIDDGVIDIYGVRLRVNDELRDEIKKQLALYDEPHYVTLLGKEYRLAIRN